MKKLIVGFLIVFTSVCFSEDATEIPKEFFGTWIGFTKFKAPATRLKVWNKAFCKVTATSVQIKNRTYKIEQISQINNWDRFDTQRNKFDPIYLISFERSRKEKWLFAKDLYNDNFNLLVVYSIRTKKEKYRIIFNVK